MSAEGALGSNITSSRTLMWDTVRVLRGLPGDGASEQCVSII